MTIEENDGRNFVMLGCFTGKVNSDLPLELSLETAWAIEALIFSDLRKQGLIPGRCISVAMLTTLYAPNHMTRELTGLVDGPVVPAEHPRP